MELVVSPSLHQHLKNEFGLLSFEGICSHLNASKLCNMDQPLWASVGKSSWLPRSVTMIPEKPMMWCNGCKRKCHGDK
eukprot:3419163-Amphidinium_carterae.1